MKLLVLALVVSVANFANGGIFGALGNAASNVASDFVDAGTGGRQNVNRNRNLRPSQNAKTLAAPAAAVASTAADAIAAPAKAGAKAAANAATAAVTKPAPPARAVPSATAALTTPAAKPKPVAPVAPVARLVPVAQTSDSPSASVALPALAATRGSKALAYAEASATAIADSAYGPAVNSHTVSADAKSSSGDAESEILSYEAEVKIDGFRYSYQTSNGISAESIGESKNINGTDVIVMEGFYEYVDKDGTTVHVNYTADENGYHPESDVLPTAPPVPPVIAEAIKYILSLNKAKEGSEAKEGSQ